MGSPRVRWIGAACLMLLAAGIFHWLPRAKVALDHEPRGPLTTPRGITLQLRKSADPQSHPPNPPIMYADAHGMTLYILDPGARQVTAACTGDCTKAWAAAVAPPDATPQGDWSVVSNADGAKQWTYRGAALYRFAGDKEIGDANGDGRDGRQALAFHPAAGMQLPDAVKVQEIADANGVGLVDSHGMTLYVRDADSKRARGSCDRGEECFRHFAPLEAPEIANPTGEFSAVAHDDGITQWTYRGQPLYVFDGDREAGDANGIWSGAGFRVALIERHFMPKDAMIRQSVELGTILAMASGTTLYVRDRPMSNSSHVFRVSRGAPMLGRALGTQSCDEKCTKTWRPFLAPADALPTGYWDIATRSDGRRQWVYKGYALYTYALDRPGDILGNGHYELVKISDGTSASSDQKPVDAGAEAAKAAFVPYGKLDAIGPGIMDWHPVVP